MFQWSITLSDKQVIALMAFFNAEPDSRGCAFYSVQAMIGDAWDVRSMRKLQEDGLISCTPCEEYQSDSKAVPYSSSVTKRNVWAITMKGRLISEAIMEDAENLRRISLRNDRSAHSELQGHANQRFFRKREESYARLRAKKQSEKSKEAAK